MALPIVPRPTVLDNCTITAYRAGMTDRDALGNWAAGYTLKGTFRARRQATMNFDERLNPQAPVKIKRQNLVTSDLYSTTGKPDLLSGDAMHVVMDDASENIWQTCVGEITYLDQTNHSSFYGTPLGKAPVVHS